MMMVVTFFFFFSCLEAAAAVARGRAVSGALVLSLAGRARVFFYALLISLPARFRFSGILDLGCFRKRMDVFYGWTAF